MLTSTATLQLPRLRFVSTAAGFVAVRHETRLDHILARRRGSQLACGLFALGIAALAVVTALGIAGF